MIKQTEIYGSSRDKFILEKFGSKCDDVIKSLYGPITKLYEDYRGAFWIYHTLSNGGFFISPDFHEDLPIYGGKFTLSPRNLGVVISLKTIEDMAFQYPSNPVLVYGLYALRAYAHEQRDAELMFNLLDPNF